MKPDWNPDWVLCAGLFGSPAPAFGAAAPATSAFGAAPAAGGTFLLNFKDPLLKNLETYRIASS